VHPPPQTPHHCHWLPRVVGFIDNIPFSVLTCTWEHIARAGIEYFTHDWTRGHTSTATLLLRAERDPQQMRRTKRSGRAHRPCRCDARSAYAEDGKETRHEADGSRMLQPPARALRLPLMAPVATFSSTVHPQAITSLVLSSLAASHVSVQAEAAPPARPLNRCQTATLAAPGSAGAQLIVTVLGDVPHPR